MDKATPSPASVDSVMVLYREVVEALLYNSDAVADAETEFLAEVQRLAAQAVDRETGSIVDALKQDVELDKQQTGRLVLEASTGIHGEVSEILAKEWAKLAERLAAQAAPSEQADFRQLMGMNEAEIDTELIAAGISPDDAVKRADRAIKEALATIRAERRASSGATTPAAPFAKDSWQHAVDNQLVAFGRTSQEFANPHEALAWLAIMNMELGQSNAGATTQAVRMLTREELNDVALSDQVGWEPGEYIEAVQRKFCAVNAGRTIPASGEIGSV